MFVDGVNRSKSAGGVVHPCAAEGAGSNADPLALDVASLASAGHYLALRIGFALPKEEVIALPSAWVDLYTRRRFMMSDPVIRWIYEGEGMCRWSAIPLADPRGILAAARDHGLVYGVAISLHDQAQGGQRSYGFFARSDREFTDTEMERLRAYLRARHEALVPPRNVTRAEIEALRLMKDGQRLKQIAYQLGVTEGAIKQRLKNARIKLDAKTGAEAISRAAFFGLI